MKPAGSVTQYVRDLRSPDKDARERAAQQIVERYFRTLVQFALRKLNRRILSLVDGEDVAQSALGSFFRCERNDQFVLETRGNLERLLIAFTLKKALKVARFHTRPKRDATRTEHAIPTLAGGDSPYPDWLFEHMDMSGPTPDEGAELADMINTLPGQLQEVVELLLMGYQDKEVAEQLRVTPETIRLRKRKIEHQWRPFFADATNERTSRSDTA